MSVASIPRVICLTDQALTRQRVCSRLASEGFAVVSESTLIDMVAYLDEFRRDLLIADVNGIGHETLREIIDGHPGLAVIALGTDTSDGEQIRALWHLGIADLMFAPFDYDELSNSVRLTLHRASSSSFGVDDIIIDEAGHLVRRAGKLVDLTTTEFKLLVNLVVNAGIVLSKHQLLNNVWGFDDYDENLVEVYVSGLRRKLEEFGPRVIHTVRGVGYVLRGETWGRPGRRAIAS